MASDQNATADGVKILNSSSVFESMQTFPCCPAGHLFPDQWRPSCLAVPISGAGVDPGARAAGECPESTPQGLHQGG